MPEPSDNHNVQDPANDFYLSTRHVNAALLFLLRTLTKFWSVSLRHSQSSLHHVCATSSSAPPAREHYHLHSVYSKVCFLRFHLLALTFNVPSTAMARTKLLPLELVDMILGWAWLEPEEVFKTLMACSHVCKTWKALSQALLFRDVPISLCHLRLSLLARALSQSPELGRHIRSFGIEITNPTASWGRSPRKDASARFRRGVSDFIVIVTHAPNLARLTIDIDGEFDSANISKLTSINPRHLHTLNWEGRPTSSVLYSLLALWPSIRYLRIDNMYLDPPPEDQRPASLCSLRVGCELPESFMMWIVPIDDEQPLRGLHFENQFPSQALKGVMAHAPTLHILTLDNFPPQSLLDALTVLKELTFCDLPSVPVRLPRSIQRVRYEFCEQREVQYRTIDLVDPLPMRLRDEEVDSRSRSADKMGHLIAALMDLPKLTLVGVTLPTPKDILAKLEKFCLEKKVEFDVYDTNALYSVSARVSVSMRSL